MPKIVTGFVGFCLILSHSATGEGTSDEAREILQKADKALKKVKLVSYDFEFKGTGGIAPRVRAVSGKMIMGKPSEEGVGRFRCDGEMENPSSLTPFKLTVGADGDNFYLVDHDKKLAYEDMDPAVLGRRGRRLMQVFFQGFVTDEPLESALAAEKIELRESVSLDGEDCYQVFVEHNPPPHVAWFFSKTDFLPRRWKRVAVKTGETEEYGSWQYTFTNIVANPDLKPEAFKLKVPEGYTKIDDYAP